MEFEGIKNRAKQATVTPFIGTGRVTRAKKKTSERKKGKTAVTEETIGKRKRTLIDNTQKQRLKTLIKADLNSALMSMIGERAGFRSI